jgi:tRNA uridine 5-carbamoylmethylation protein Kti12
MKMIEKFLYIMRGVSGSGKSTIASLLKSSIRRVYGSCAVYSTDNLWYDSKGIYQFDPKKLREKHKQNQDHVRAAMTISIPNIIVDNTNTTQKETQPYLDLAKEYGYTVQVITVSCNLDVAKLRNRKRPVDRMVPEEVIDRQNARMERIKL